MNRKSSIFRALNNLCVKSASINDVYPGGMTNQPLSVVLLKMRIKKADFLQRNF